MIVNLGNSLDNPTQTREQKPVYELPARVARDDGILKGRGSGHGSGD
jgi:hypothetical protein